MSDTKKITTEQANNKLASDILLQVNKLSLVDNDIILLHVSEPLSNSAMDVLKKVLVGHGFNQLVFVLVRNDHVDKMTTDQLIKFIKGQIEVRDNTVELMEHGLMKLANVKRLMNEQSLVPDRRAQELIDEFLEKNKQKGKR